MKAAALIGTLFLASCALPGPTEVEGSVPFVGSVALRTGKGGEVGPAPVRPPDSVQALFSCLTKPRDPLTPFDSCECFRQFRVDIPESSDCFEGEARMETPHDFEQVWGALYQPELKYCEHRTGKDGDNFIVCELQ